MLDLGGTYRAYSSKETLEKIEPMLWDKFGITRVANITGLDDICLPTYIAIRPLSKMLTTSQGKGITHDLAKISAIMESIESWHGERLPAPDLFGSHHQLKNTHTLVDLEPLWNSTFNYDPGKTNNFELPWLKGTELNTGRDVYFPMNLIDLDSVLSNLDRSGGYFCATSNGLASGNTKEEALCHAIYELIERHCWAKAEKHPPRFVDLSSIQSPHLREILDHLEAKSVRLEVMDMTDELNVPTYRANLFDLSGVHAIGTYTGAGAHFSSVVALSRAITEAIQSRLTMISGSRDDMYPSVYQSVELSARMNGIRTASLRTLHPFKETTMPADFNNCIHQLLQRLKTYGFEQVIVYDHTKEDIGIPVVHVIIPGLEFDVNKHRNQAYFPEQLRELNCK